MNNYQEKQYRDLFNILSIKFILLFVVSFIILPPYKISFAAELANNGSLTAPTTTGEAGTPAEWTAVGSPDLKSTNPETGKFTFHITPTGPSPDGGTWLSLYSSSPSSGEGIKQQMSTVAGTTYLVSFYTGAFGINYPPTNTYSRGSGYIEVYEGTSGSTGTLIHTSNLLSLSSAWSTESFSFTASANNSYIYFVARYFSLPGADTASTYLSIDGISVQDNPASISPSSQSLSAQLGVAISPTSSFSETGFSGSVTYTISPSLPTGLAMDGTTGVISGNPTTTSSSTSYTITATGATSGVATSTITISVSDTNSPTVTFNPTNGAAGISVDTDITLTFSEAVRNLDDTALTDANVDSLVELKLNNSSGTPIAFDATIDADKKIITINPSSNFQINSTVYVALKASSVEDSSDNAVSATSITFNTSLDNPFEKRDVLGNIEAMSQAAIRFNRMSINSVNSRFRWLRNNRGSANTSHQGIKFTSNGKSLNGRSNNPFTLLSTKQEPIPQTGLNRQRLSNEQNNELNNLDKFSEANYNLIQNSTFTNENIKISAADSLKGLLLSAADLNPTFGKIGGGFSVWTDGMIEVGDMSLSGKASDQNFHGFNIAIGIDKFFGGNDFFGSAINVAQSETKVGADGSKVDAKNIGLSFYGYKNISEDLGIEAQLGYASMEFHTNRIDSTQILKGNRDGKMLFASAAIVPEQAIQFNKMYITPFSRGEWSYIELESYSENGGSNALYFDTQHINRYMLFAGTDIYFDLDFAKGKLKPFVGFEYGLDLTKNSDVGLHYVNSPGTSYQSTLKMVARSNVMFKTGLEYKNESGVSSSIQFQQNEAIGYGSYHIVNIHIDIPF